MKRLFLFAAAVLGMFAAFSCQEKEEILTLTSTTYTVSNAGSVQTISFNASTDWTMVSEAEWISLDKTSGIAGPATVTMTVAANTDYADRSAKVVLTMADKITEFKVNQTELKGFGTSASLEIDAKEQDVTVGVKSNVEYTVTVDEDAKDWIEVVKTKAAPTEGTIVLHVSANTGLAPRTGKFTIAADGTSQDYQIIQSAEYIPASEASALYLRNRQRVYDNANWEFTGFGQFAIILKTEENEEIRLVVNNARRDGDYNELGIGSALIDGSYEVDATATNADKTFSIKTTDGHELYYTTILAGEKEISVIDGEINISTAEDGTVTITAILVDAAEALHRYSYQGKIEVVDASYGGNAESPAFYNTYNTYYTTKANEWDVQIYISEDGKKPEEYVRYASIHFFGPAGETDGKEIPEGKYTLAELAADATSSYLNGITIANPMTMSLSVYTDDNNEAFPDYSKGGYITVSRNDNGTYNFEFDVTLKGMGYNDMWELVETGTVIEYKKTLKDVYVPESYVANVPCPDGDFVASSIFYSKYIGMWYGDAMGNGGNTFVLGFSGGAINYNYELYLGLNVSGDWTFEKNFAGKYCTNPIPAGRYEFSAEGAVNSIIPVKYGTMVYCYVKNLYTGTQMKICGGYVDITADKFTYNLQLKAGEKVYTMTGSHPAELSYFRDYSSRAKNLKLYTVE